MVKTPEVTNSEFQQQVLNADLPVLVDFWAEKCGPGHTISPILEGLTEECDGKIKFVKIDTLENYHTAAATASLACPGERSYLRVEKKTVGELKKGNYHSHYRTLRR